MLTSYLALDVGRARIGLAVANNVARIASPLVALANDEQFVSTLQKLISDNNVSELIVGWPRGLDGQETDQTHYVGTFIARLKSSLDVPIHQQDEALTSVKAEAELQRRRTAYSKGEIDSLSAVYILEDYLAEGVN